MARPVSTVAWILSHSVLGRGSGVRRLDAFGCVTKARVAGLRISRLAMELWPKIWLSCRALIEAHARIAPC